MKKIYNKLVRDRIPEVIEQAGKKAQIQQVNSLGLHRYALDKLREEVEEFVENPCAEEAADILEILDFICTREGISDREIKAAAIAKRVERGAFEMGYILEWVEE